jgi:hypothetical protein
MDDPRPILLLLYLVAGHALVDFAWQSEAMALGKCPRTQHPAARAVPWYYWLAAHALLHGAAVGLVCQGMGVAPARTLALALAETLAHALIDLGKCRGWYGIHRDQALHLLCKLLWWCLAVGAFPSRGGS